MRNLSRYVVAVIIACGLLAAGLSCAKKVTKPKPVEYRLYASGPWDKENGATYIYVIDAEADTVIDTLRYQDDHAYLGITASPDGKYLGIVGGQPNSRIYDASTLTMLAELNHRDYLAFVPEAGVIIGDGYHKLRLYDYHTFELIHEEDQCLEIPQIFPGQSVAYGLESYTPGSMDSTGFVEYDCREREVLRSWPPFARRGGGKHEIIFRCFHIGPDRHRIYATSGITSSDGARIGYTIFCHDFDADSAIFEQPIYSPYGFVQVSPDGREVYLTDPGFPPSEAPTPGKIFIYDAGNGALLDEISLLDLDTTGYRPRPLFAYGIKFHPEKPKAYVACGNPMKDAPGTILVIDTDKREIIKYIFPELDQIVEWIDIGPRR